MITISLSQTLPLTAAFAATLISAPTWTVSDQGIGSLTVDPSGVTATFQPLNIGECTVTFSGTTGLGTTSGSIDIIVVASLPAIPCVVSPGVPS